VLRGGPARRSSHFETSCRARQEISAIDVQENWDDILDQLRQTPHTRLPVYDGELDKLFGILHMKRVAHELARGTLTRDKLIEVASSREPYFVPESTALTVQLTQFQRNRRRLAFVVNEYGDIEGLVTLEDILEEIVGEFTSQAIGSSTLFHREPDGSVIADGTCSLRVLNRKAGFEFPLEGPKTINGLLLEQLEDIPEAGVSLLVAGHPIEILQVQDRMVKVVRILPKVVEAPEAEAA